jgi:hypothetical protein
MTSGIWSVLPRLFLGSFVNSVFNYYCFYKRRSNFFCKEAEFNFSASFLLLFRNLIIRHNNRVTYKKEAFLQVHQAGPECVQGPPESRELCEVSQQL